jgi:hypothetical protein
MTSAISPIEQLLTLKKGWDAPHFEVMCLCAKRRVFNVGRSNVRGPTQSSDLLKNTTSVVALTYSSTNMTTASRRKNMTSEEQALYKQARSVMTEWKILEDEE